MRKPLPYKTKQFFVVLMKLSIVVLAFYFIYQKLVHNSELDFSVFIENLTENNVFSIKNVLFLVILTVFNWFFEIVKWKKLAGIIKPISFKNALEQSLGALTASLLTPNRIGEYGAKAIYYVKPLRKKIMLLNLVGNIFQMLTTLLFGIIGLLYLSKIYDLPINIAGILGIGLLILTGLLVLYFSLKKNRFEIKGFSFKKIIQFVFYIPSDIKLKIFALSVVRYLIFSFQFYLLLKIFGVQIDYLHAMMLIASMYLMSSIVPSIFIFDVVIKGSVGVYVFALAGINSLTVLCIVTIMWLLNFVVPSVFGSFYVLNFTLPTEETNQ